MMISEVFNKDTPVIIAFGYFDSVHFAHRKIIEEVRRQAVDNTFSAVLTFKTNAYIELKSNFNQVYTFSERLSILDDLNVNYCVAIPFNSETKNLSGEEFLRRVRSMINVKGIVCGYDFRYGKDRSCGIAELDNYCNLNGIKLTVVQPILLNGERVSTTAIRELLILGKVQEANELLGDNFFIDGKVIHGRGDGHKFGIPTANLSCDENKIKIKRGVYATKIVIGQKEYSAVTNVGEKPTVNDYSYSIETLIKDFSGDIYDERARVKFVKYLRDTVKFNSVDELRNQVQKDLLWTEKTTN